MKILIIEDGHEYLTNAERLLADDFVWIRAGSGRQGLQMLQSQTFDAVLLDMCFDRVALSDLLGDVDELTSRFQGERARAVTHLQRHQGNYILAYLRQHGCQLPVLLSYDFDAEPRRWVHVKDNFGPIDYLADNFGPTELAAKLYTLIGR